MSLRNKIDEDYKQTIKNKDKHKTDTLRLIRSAIKDKDIASRTSDNKEGINDSEILSLLISLIKQRKDSIEQFQKAKRDDLIQSEQSEIEIIKEYLPQQKTEEEKLATIKANLDSSEKERIIEQALALARRQSQADDPHLLPKVGLEDVPPKIVEPARIDETLTSSQASVSFYGQGTNNLAYQQIVLPLPQLSPEQLEILPLYTSCLTEFGIADKNYAEVQTWHSRISGGVNCFSSIRSAGDDEQSASGYLTFSSKALTSNHRQMSALLKATLSETRFDETQRLADLVEQICTRKEASITGQGHSLAMSLACSRMSPVAQLNHQFGGLEGIHRLQRHREALSGSNEREKLIFRIQELHETLLTGPKHFLLIGEAHRKNALIADLDAQWDANLNGQPQNQLSLRPVRAQLIEAWSTATQVSFCAKAYPTVCANHPDHAVLQVLAGFLRNGFLHTAIREKGGAYGGGASQEANSASFRFFSYRDPRLSETLLDFDRAIGWLLDEKHSENQIEEAILGVIAAMDKTSSPAKVRLGFKVSVRRCGLSSSRRLMSPGI